MCIQSWYFLSIPWCALIIIPYTSLYLPYTIAYTDCIHLKEGSLYRVLYAMCIPDSFFRSDDKVRGCRHFIFASYQQLQFLAWAKSWYIDGTFKLCRQPFTQLPTINVSIKHEDHAKQVLLLFILMSGRKKNDLWKIFKQLLEILVSAPATEQITLDFETAVWAALKKGMPQAKLQGCMFHWTQALWGKVRWHFIKTDNNIWSF